MAGGIDRVTEWLSDTFIEPAVKDSLEDPDVREALAGAAGEAAAEVARRPEVTALVMTGAAALLLAALVIRR